MQTYELMINENKYVLRSANFFETKTQLQSLLGLAKDAIKMQGEDVNIDVGQIIANIGSPDCCSVCRCRSLAQIISSKTAGMLLQSFVPDSE